MVTAIGPDVANHKVGDAVGGMSADGCWATFVTVMRVRRHQERPEGARMLGTDHAEQATQSALVKIGNVIRPRIEIGT
jgi:NADPH:quinone reductase-like Zn-dependent oxidoreductase